MCKMGKQILIYPNDRIFYDNMEFDADKFIEFINELVNSGYVLTFYDALGGFLFSNPKNDESYFLRFSILDIENYKNGVYTLITNELQKLLLSQEQKELPVKAKIKKIIFTK